MQSLQKEEIIRYNILGLREICRYNRDIFSSFNRLSWDELYLLLCRKIDENNIIKVAPFILNNNFYIRKINIKLYYKYNRNGKKGFETECIL